MSIYLELTREFNAGRLRAMVSSGQAVVLHRLSRYQQAAERWAAAWPEVQRAIDGQSLREAHAVMVQRAAGVLAYAVEELTS